MEIPARERRRPGRALVHDNIAERRNMTIELNARPLRAGGYLLALLALVACSPRVPSKLDEPMIRSLASAGARAAAQRDATALCSQLTDDAKIRLVEVRFTGSDIKRFDKPQWCEYLKLGYAAMPANVEVSTSVNVRSIAIAADGKSAGMEADVIEEINLGGRGLRMTSQQSATVVLVAGQAKYSEVSARLTGGQ
jgi:hypothetical protein